MAFAVFGAGGDESGGRLSGFGHFDVGGLDDAAGDYGAAVGEKHGRVAAAFGAGGAAVRFWRPAVFLLCGNSVGAGDYSVVRRVLFGVGADWLGKRRAA